VLQAIAQSHKALQASEERFRRFAENMLDMVAETDLLGVCTYASPSLKTVVGYAPKDLLGQSLFELVHPDDLDNLLEIKIQNRETLNGWVAPCQE